jgi:RNA polymerase sigma factor (sigma-70 family)
VQELKAENILVGLRDRDTKVLDYIYKNFYEQIKVFILRNRGSIEDAKDVYQDALLVIYQKASKDNLELSCSFQTYLYSVCRLLWLKQLESNQIQRNTAEETGMYIELDEDLVEVFEKNERYKLYQHHFQKLSFSCQKVLELFLAGISLREIANILGFKSEHYVKKRKYQCKEKLISSIKSDPNFKQYIVQNSNLKRS